jgi:lysophospholipase L1-like esterase
VAKQFYALTLIVLCVLCGGCSATHVGVSAKLDQDGKHVAPMVVFMGDSITNLWDVAGFGQSFFNQHPTWIDAGVIGDDSGQMADRFQAQVADLHPQVVVILAGTNDVYPDWQLCGGLHNWDTCDQIAYMVNVATNQGIQPILATIPPWGCVDADNHCALAARADSDPARYAKIDQLNAWIKQFAFDHNLIVVDYHSALVAADGQHYRPDLTVDGVHPTTAGYALMTPIVEDAITASQMK